MKLELYKAYKTSAGHKAVVVDGPTKEGIYSVWHAFDNSQRFHDAKGLYAIAHIRDYDLVSEWHEPKRGEFWVNVYNDREAYVYKTKGDAEMFSTPGLIATKRVTWTEGDEE